MSVEKMNTYNDNIQEHMIGAWEGKKPRFHKGVYGKKYDSYSCGECGHGIVVQNDYCPNCGYRILWDSPRCLTR